MSNSEADTSRTVVRTYIPAYQRENWDRHADQLDMSRSEYVRTMVQAGRRGFGANNTSPPGSGTESTDTDTAETQSLDERVRTELAENGPLSWDELLVAVTGDIESQLDETLQRLQRDNEVQYSGRDGGYILEDET